MTLPRIDRMTEAPTLGCWYMVPTVRGEWLGMDCADWPVVGPLHDDAQFFHFRWKHYHIDGRFLTIRQQRQIVGFWNTEKFHERLTRQCIGAPLQTSPNNTNSDGLPKPILRKKQCAIDVMAPPGPDITSSKQWKALAHAFAGRVCTHGKRGFICPHQNVALGAVAAIDGVITCPLHGLRIDAESGRVLA